ncbi:hypothetical protein AAEX63_11385 [Luteococcus sp. H138]|uniref:hypothetical protein n=1 Tax=unclassified Luteococcus TaxID=2639923 RepID=UPI00313ECAFF
MRHELILLCEDNFQGHRWNYVELLARRAREWGADVRLVTTAPALEELAGIAEPPADLPVDVLADASLSNLADHATTLGASRVVIPDGDHHALRLARPGSWPAPCEVRLLVMREHAQPRSSRVLTAAIEYIRRALFRLASRQARVQLRYLSSALATPDASHVPDPVTLAPDAQPPVPLTGDRFWFGVLGALDERKNVPVVQQALDMLDPQQVGLVLAGRLAPEIADQVTSHHSEAPVHILDARLSDGELDSLVANLDCLVLLYSNQAPSGMVAKAAAAGTRVILPGTPAYEADCRRLGAGAAQCEITPEGAAAAMRDMMDRPSPAALELGADDFVRGLMF